MLLREGNLQKTNKNVDGKLEDVHSILSLYMGH